jgi:hypothetical protein
MRLTPFDSDVCNAVDAGACYYDQIIEHLKRRGRRQISDAVLMRSVARLIEAGVLRRSMAHRLCIVEISQRKEPA